MRCHLLLHHLQKFWYGHRSARTHLHTCQWQGIGGVVGREKGQHPRGGTRPCENVPPLFLTLDPDDRVIEANITKALYLADASAKRQYDNLKEGRYYSNIISGNISQEIFTDSIRIDINQYPFYFRYYAKEKLIRTSSIVTRSVITEGYLRNVSRSDNNPHGFLIEKWNTLENKDLKTENR